MKKINFLSAIFLILIGVVGRFVLIDFVSIPNFEIITALTLISAVFLGRIWAFVVPLSIIAITDAAIGNGSVLLFTWSAFAMIGALGMLYKNAKPQAMKARFEILGLTGMGIVSSVFFFLYTNFGWWMVSSMYPHTLDGLIQCYAMGLPFFKNNLIGNLIFVPMFSIAAVFLRSVSKNKIWNQKKTLDLQKI
jgi:hypothetical protein